MNKITFPKEIATKRIPVKTPAQIVDANGQFVFGTYKEPFQNINMLDAKRPFGLPMSRRLKSHHLKDWEAVEVAFDEGFLVSAVYNLGLLAFNIIMFYEYESQQCFAWQKFAPFPNKIKNHWSLLNSTKSMKINEKWESFFTNNYEKGQASYCAKAYTKKDGEAKVDVQLENISQPSNVCVPFGKNQALYSQKDFFKASGSFSYHGKTITANENTVAVIDDHKGFYPYKMHYYWVTGMGTQQLAGNKKRKIAFNLTENQSIDPENYNENLLWLEGESYPLPPVHFTFEKGTWFAKDEFGYVDIKFKPDSSFKMRVEALFIRAKYTAPFGKIEGTIKGYDGTIYDVTGLAGMGEDKTYWM